MSEPSSQRLPQLDGIRGIAILLVLIWHYITTNLDPNASPLIRFLSDLLGFTWSGVDLFFVLSGFLIGGILLDHRETPHYFKAFYIRRICRIFPLYFAWLFLFFAITLVLPALALSYPFNFLFQYPAPFWSYATFTQNFGMASASTFGPDWLGVTWSLAIEEQFYLILPLMVRFIPIRKLPFVLITLIVSAPILRMILIFVPPHSTFPNYVLMPTRADALLLGTLSAYLLRQPSAAQYLRNHIAHLYIAFGILLGGTGILFATEHSLRELLMSAYGFTLLALLYACFILIAMVEPRGVVSRLTKNAWLGHLGILAYGAYMIHQAINNLAHGLILKQFPQLHTLDDLLVSAGALVITFLIAYASWNVFEKRIVAIGHSFSYVDPVGQPVRRHAIKHTRP